MDSKVRNFFDPLSATDRKAEDLLCRYDPFEEKLGEVARDLVIPSNWLRAVISFETGGTFRPDIRNRALVAEGRKNAPVGLIQFTSAVAEELGTTSDDLEKMSATDQLDYVRDYFLLQKKRLKLERIESLGQLYLMVLYPRAATRGEAEAVFTEGTRLWELNHSAFGEDASVDGKITVGEIGNALLKHFRKLGL